MTRVSVVTAAHNAADVIERNVRSVASQSLKAQEHIIVDDGSTDNTSVIIQDLTREFAHLRLIRQQNRGAGPARNAGIEAANARFVAFLDCDDYWTENKLQAQIGFMLSNGVPFSYGDYDTVDAETGALLYRHASPPKVGHTQLLRGCPIGCLTVAFDQEALGKRYMPAVRRGQDWALWLSLTRDGTFAERYPGCHAVYTKSRDSLSSRKLKKAADIYRIYREQEGLGVLRSACYVVPHSLNALTKSVW